MMAGIRERTSMRFTMKFEKVEYDSLSARQKELYNFQVVAGKLAEYGFNCIKLSDDWHGADFLAYHKDGIETLKVQLKSRVLISSKYQDKDIWMCFPDGSATDPKWYLVPHDELVVIVGNCTSWLESGSWTKFGQYSSRSPSRQLLNALSDFAID